MKYMPTDNNEEKVRVKDLKVNDIFIMNNQEYEVAKISGTTLYYKTIYGVSVTKNSNMSIKSQRFVLRQKLSVDSNS